MQIGAQLLGGADARDEADPGQPESARVLPRPQADGTLLAVVPIPGTGTSMAIVGYPVTAPGGTPAIASDSAVGAERLGQLIQVVTDTLDEKGFALRNVRDSALKKAVATGSPPCHQRGCC